MDNRHFGLIGHPLGHSLSPLIHQTIMETAGIKAEYHLYDIAPEHLESELPKLLKTLDGFNCTIPHKQTVIPYLDDLAPSARLYGAVNTVYNGKGYNTDGTGFAACGVVMAGRHVGITGAGGVAHVLAMEAARAGAAQIVVDARNKERAKALVNRVKATGYDTIWAADDPINDPAVDPVVDPAINPAINPAIDPAAQNMKWDVILNGTPVGMWPDIGGLAVDERRISLAQAGFDSVYNPAATRLVLKARSRGIPAIGGLKMLFEQALAAERIWNPDIDFDCIKDQLSHIPAGLARAVLRQSPVKLLITGFMGSGKTLVGRSLSKLMGTDLPFIDLDTVIAQRAGQSISHIFSSEGEGTFRALERECLLEQLRTPGAAIIATGGGALVQPGAADAAHAAGALIIYLAVSLETALRRIRPSMGADAERPGIGADTERPMLSEDDPATQALYDSRLPLYETAADLTVPADGHITSIVQAILAGFEWEE